MSWIALNRMVVARVRNNAMWIDLVAVPSSNVSSIVSSIWSCGFETTSWFAPPSNSTLSIIPFVCWRSNICRFWIRFRASPIVWRCRPAAVFGPDLACAIGDLMALDLRWKHNKKQKSNQFYMVEKAACAVRCAFNELPN